MHNIIEDQIQHAARIYPQRVTGPMAGCKHPADVLRFALKCGGDCARLAENFILTGHGACWNALCNILPANGWLVWYAGGTAQC